MPCCVSTRLISVSARLLSISSCSRNDRIAFFGASRRAAADEPPPNHDQDHPNIVSCRVARALTGSNAKFRSVSNEEGRVAGIEVQIVVRRNRAREEGNSGVKWYPTQWTLEREGPAERICLKAYGLGCQHLES